MESAVFDAAVLASSHMDFEVGSGVVSALLTILIATFIVRSAARIVIDRGGFFEALVVVVLGTVLATLVWGLVGGILGMILAIATWALIAAFVFRTAWLKGAVIGVAAWLIWFLISLLVTWLVGRA